MKTLTLLFTAALLAPSLCADPLVVTDLDAESTLRNNLPLMNTNIAGILKDADNQLIELKKLTDSSSGLTAAIKETTARLDDLLNRIGDPKTVHPSNGVNAVKTDLTQAATGLQHFPDSNGVKDGQTVDKNTLLNNLYNENGGGLFTPVGTTYKPDKGDPVNRGTTTNKDVPATDYSLEAGENQAIKDYFRVRDLALNRRDALQGVLSDALDQLNNAQDFATTAKITAVIQALQSQLQACSDDINNSYNDTAVRGLQAYVLGSVKSKADAEPRMAAMGDKLQSAIDASKTHPAPPPTVSSTADYSSTAAGGSYLPWVKYSSH